MIIWDVLVRYLRFRGYGVSWARNITDIDDKIIKRSQQLQISPEKLTRIETFKFWQDMHTLNISIPDREPRATEFIPDMISFISDLVEHNHAYQTDSGDVYFRVSSWQKYGQLKSVCKDNEDNVARIEHQSCKGSASDFALWKAAKPEERSYESPFGNGRPGWHLECSAMIKKLFGETIDIHGGGEDLLFPHHENEIAQSECLHHKPLARYWMHNGMIMINGRKMSKSAGNYITVAESVRRYSGNAIRFFVLSGHYRQPINYTEEALDAAQRKINKIFDRLDSLSPSEHKEIEQAELSIDHLERFHQCMSADLNTPQALSILISLHKDAYSQTNCDPALLKTFCYLAKVLGFDFDQRAHSQSQHSLQMKPIEDLLLDLRQKARQEKDFALADRIRDTLWASGYEIKDLPSGQSELKARCL